MASGLKPQASRSVTERSAGPRRCSAAACCGGGGRAHRDIGGRRRCIVVLTSGAGNASSETITPSDTASSGITQTGSGNEISGSFTQYDSILESDDYSEDDVDQGETDDLYDDDGTSGTETDSGSLTGFVTQGSTSTDTEDSGDDSSNQTDGDDEDDPVTTTSTSTTTVNYLTGAYSIAETDSFHSTATDGDSNNGAVDNDTETDSGGDTINSSPAMRFPEPIAYPNTKATPIAPTNSTPTRLIPATGDRHRHQHFHDDSERQYPQRGDEPDGSGYQQRHQRRNRRRPGR